MSKSSHKDEIKTYFHDKGLSPEQTLCVINLIIIIN